jgi:hypothetical protein
MAIQELRESWQAETVEWRKAFVQAMTQAYQFRPVLYPDGRLIVEVEGLPPE